MKFKLFLILYFLLLAISAAWLAGKNANDSRKAHTGNSINSRLASKQTQ